MKNDSRSPAAMLLACLILGLGLGFGLGCRNDAAPAPNARELEAILRLPDAEQRAGLLLDHLEAATLDDLPEITAAYREAWHAVDEVSTVMLAVWWAKRDPAGAFDGGRDVIRTAQNVWSPTVVRIWARQDPETALEAVHDAQSAAMATEWSRSLRFALVRGWFDGKADPLPLLEFLRTLPVGRPVKETLDVFLERLVDARGVEEAIRTVETIRVASPTEVGFRRDVYQRLAGVLSDLDPRIAIEWADRHQDEPEGELLHQRIARHWSRRDPEASLDWVATWPQGEKRNRAMMANFRIFLALDSDGALAWLDRQTDAGTAQRLLYRISISHLVRRGRALEAIERLEAVDDPQRRERLMIAALGEWLGSDREAAEAWLAEHPQPEEILREARRRRPRGGPAGADGPATFDSGAEDGADDGVEELN